MSLMPAADKVRLETELAAVMPASHTRYLFPLAPVVDEPLSYEEVAILAAPSERYKVMAITPDPELVARGADLLRHNIAMRSERIAGEHKAAVQAKATLNASIDHLAELVIALEAAEAAEVTR